MILSFVMRLLLVSVPLSEGTRGGSWVIRAALSDPPLASALGIVSFVRRLLIVSVHR